MVKAFQVNDEDLREAVDSQVLLNVYLFFTAAAFESCPNHSLRFNKLVHALAELDAAEVADCLARDLDTKIHEIVKGAILMTTAEALCAINELTLEQVRHDRVVSCFVQAGTLLALLIYSHVLEVKLAVGWFCCDAIQLVMHAVDQKTHELL